MAEIINARVRSIYGDIKGFADQVQTGNEFVKGSIVDSINKRIDELSTVTDTDYSNCKISSEWASTKTSHLGNYQSKDVRMQLSRLVGRLEQEYNLSVQTEQNSRSLNIFNIENKNDNNINVQIDYTIADLIGRSENDEEKKQLKTLEKELEKPNKNWEAIKKALMWIANFSKDAFLEVLPIILQKYGK